MTARADQGAAEGFVADLDASQSVLAVAFGGMMMSVGGIPPFEFFRILSGVAPVKKLFLRDHAQSWYHRGVRALADDIEGTEAWIRRIVADTNPSRLVMLGASAGGYGALLFGRLLGAAEVHAFAPQTFLSADLRRRYDDPRWPAEWSDLMRSGRYQRRYGDLLRLFERTPAMGTRFVVHYCQDERLDAAHAERLGQHSDVELRAYEHGGHEMVKHLRKRGELRPLLQELLSE